MIRGGLRYTGARLRDWSRRKVIVHLLMHHVETPIPTHVSIEKKKEKNVSIVCRVREHVACNTGLSAAARAAAAAVVVRHERLLLEPLHALLQGLDEGAAAAACEAAWVARL